MHHLWSAIANTCPVCKNGKIFHSITGMNRECPSCKFVFEKEQGYFTGAMALSYVLGFIVVLPPFLYLLFTEAEFFTLIAIPAVLLTLFAPLSFRYSRLIWIGLDHTSEARNK